MSTRIASRTLVEKLPISRPSQYVCRACRQSQSVTQQRRFASNDSNEPKEETFLDKTRKKLWQGQPPGPENIDDVYGGPGFFATMNKERKERKEMERLNARNQRRKLDKESIPLEERQIPKLRPEEITEEESVFKQPTQADFIAEATGRGRIVDSETRKPSQTRDIHQTRAGQEFVDEDLPPVPLADEVKTWDGLESIGHQGQWELMPENPADDYQPWQVMDSNLKWTNDELVSLMAIAAEEGAMTDMVFLPGDASLPQLSEAEKSELLSRPLSFTQKDSSLQLLSRFSYLVRRRIPDPVLTKISKRNNNPTVQEFLELFAAKTNPKPANVAEILFNNEKLAAHSNLLVLGRRETPVDKEKEVGRWKLIEAQLKERGLPVLGKVQREVRQ